MKVECVKNKLYNLLQKTERVTGKNQNLPILSCFLLSAEGGVLTVHATNLDLGVKSSTLVRVLKEGKVVVPASVFFGFLSQLTNDENVSLESVGGVLEVSTKHTKTNIKLFDSKVFPNIPISNNTTQNIIPTTDLLKGLQSVWFSASVSAMKPELSSVCIYYDQKNLVFVATDSFRLAEKKVATKPLDIQPILIPFKNVVDIIKILDGHEGNISVSSSKGQVSFLGEGVYIVSRVIEGSFPDYQQIIPKEFKTEVVLLKQDLISSLKLSNIFSNTFNQINFFLSPSKKTFELNTQNEHVGKSVVKVDAVVKGEELNVDFNHRYLTDCFQPISSDSISLRFSGAHKPLVLQGVGDTSFIYLVMPMNK